MKKNLLALFCYFSIFCFSQEYHFDYKCYDSETQLEGAYKGNKRTNIIYFNSENKDVMAYDYFFSQQPTRSFWLYDFKTNNFLSYLISHDSKFSSLNFIQKIPIKIYPDEKKIERIDVEKLKENVYLISTYPSEKSKKSNLELKIIIEKSNFSMPRIRFVDLTPNIHSKIYDALLSRLDSPKYRLVDVIIDNKKGVIMHDDLSKCEKINLKFLAEQIPNK
ncbi:hypothetical protein N0B16_06335 [Chryseobacterium sp. GMJ5]|uniref:Outer membrane lipoprotein carrier protein LolA n=1 Tax=Chryseobacterium gilvum TaxID=2976534 RepID=A0ABT2VVM4_9FLAO|nr:hypothetical protein [Chryseobacterium gilvum]MCU7614050.1 hypothetical protein [Chryseobacterium gilvum]